jgi:hypothetical protein
MVALVFFTALRVTAGLQPLTNGSFEKGFAGWQAMEQFYNVAAVNAHGGSRIAVLGVATNNVTSFNNAKGSLSQQIVLPVNSSASLVFWLQITTMEPQTAAAKDNFYVDVLSQSGALLRTELTLSNRDASAVYVRRAVSLAAYAGKTVRVQFRGLTDSTNATVFRLDDVSLAAPTSISGVVTNSATGATIGGATVTFAGGAPVKSGADGRYTLNDVICASGTLSVVASGFESANLPYTPECGMVNQKNVALDPPPTSITGIVRDSSTNAPLINVAVAFAGQTQHTNSDGSYVFTKVPCQSGPLVFSATDFDMYRIDTYQPTCGRSNRVDVPLVPQLTALIGYVSDDDLGVAIPNAQVTFGSAYKTTTNEQGTYLIAPIACAPASLTVSVPGYSTVTRAVTPVCQQTAVENARLVPHLTTITGVVTDQFTGAVLTNANVLMNKTNATTQGGSYELVVACSEVRLDVSAPGYVPTVLYHTPACGGVNTANLALMPVPSGTSVCGRVSDSDNSRGVDGVTVNIGTRATTSDLNGSYCIALTLCGTPTTISFEKPGYRPTSRTQTLGCGGPTRLDVIMSQAHVDGSVVDADTNAPIVGAAVTYGADKTTTGAGGRFSFRNFCREQDHINVTMPGFQPYSAQATGVICSNVLPTISTIKLHSISTSLFVALQENPSGKPVTGAFVRWANTPGVPDGKGGYGFTQALCQSAAFVAYTLRYGTNRIALTPACGASILQPIFVDPVRTTIRGSVRDGIHGGMLADATATWMSVSVVTDQNGIFTLDYVPCGSGKITLSKAGYKSQDVAVIADCKNELNFGGTTTLGQ